MSDTILRPFGALIVPDQLLINWAVKKDIQVSVLLGISAQNIGRSSI